MSITGVYTLVVFGIMLPRTMQLFRLKKLEEQARQGRKEGVRITYRSRARLTISVKTLFIRKSTKQVK